MLRLALVRHGETEWNKERRYQGQVDVPLSAIGEEQAALVANALSGRKFDAIYTSDLKRAWQTATAILEKNGQNELSIFPEPRLREMSFGVLEGLTWDEAQEKHSPMLEAWMADYNQAPEGGESLDIFSSRISSFMAALGKKHAKKTILLVAHGGTLGEIICLSLSLPTEKRWAFTIDNASISEIILADDGYSILKHLNDTCHLR